LTEDANNPLSSGSRPATRTRDDGHVSGELLMALISAVAACSPPRSAWCCAPGRPAGRHGRKGELERRRQQASKEELVEQVMSCYREPPLGAAFDLQSRINIVRQGFLVRYLQRGDPVQ
jgi:hypothetical protein